MNVYERKSLKERIAGNPYVGRGIVIGRSTDGSKAACAYFIMGRSANSRNRVFLEQGEDLMIRPYDESKVEDPSLIIYYPIRVAGDMTIVTNGDQTDTIYDHMVTENESFADALRTREFEPDGPNWTPRISGLIDLSDDMTYKMSILKSQDAEGTACTRQFFEYVGQPGLGHFLHTYVTDGEPIPTFVGEPERVEIPDDIDELKDMIWENLDQNNRISLYERYIDLKTGTTENRLINRNGGAE